MVDFKKALRELEQTNKLKTMATQNRKRSVVDDNFTGDPELDNKSTDDDFQAGDIGEFDVAQLKDEKDIWRGHIISDVSKDGYPEWLPDAFDPNCYVTKLENGKKGIISKFWKLEEYIYKYGFGLGIVYQVIRGKKTEKGKNRSYVDFDIKFKIIDQKQVKMVPRRD